MNETTDASFPDALQDLVNASYYYEAKRNVYIAAQQLGECLQTFVGNGDVELFNTPRIVDNAILLDYYNKWSVARQNFEAIKFMGDSQISQRLADDNIWDKVEK